MPLTLPGPTDCHWAAITMSPEAITVEFAETQRDAVEAAHANLMPAVSTYVAQVVLQGEHRTRGTAQHIAVHVAVTPAIRAALRARYPALRSRADVQRALSDLLATAIAGLGAPREWDEEITAVLRGRP